MTYLFEKGCFLNPGEGYASMSSPLDPLLIGGARNGPSAVLNIISERQVFVPPGNELRFSVAVLLSRRDRRSSWTGTFTDHSDGFHTAYNRTPPGNLLSDRYLRITQYLPNILSPCSKS
ncbi:hypothetical protein J6590_004744 [Homalodisca vitripennis]|nr:hypothetical protein J6590_004744 [Homalodisca vitripennis]